MFPARRTGFRRPRAETDGVPQPRNERNGDRMARRKWYRLYHGLPGDVTLAVAARRAGLSRAEMLALWICLIDHASQQDSPGSLADLDAEALALLLDLDAARITAALAALRDKKRIDSHQRIVGWDRHQSSSTRRVQALRARRRMAAAPPRPAAPSAKPVAKAPVRPAEADTPAAIAARRARLQQNNHLIIGQPLRPSQS